MANWEPTEAARRKMLFRNLPGGLVDDILEHFEAEYPGEAPGARVREATIEGVKYRVVFFPGDPMRVPSIHEVRPLPKRPPKRKR